jgi:purine catabolism regulator
VICLLPAAGPAERLRQRVHRVWEDLQQAADGRPVVLAIGRAQRGPAGIPASLQQAEATLRAGRGGGLRWYEDLVVVRILGSSQDHEAMRGLYDLTVGALQAHSPALADTARVLVAAGFNQRLAARRLGLHWNTLRYRMTRMEELLGGRLDDPEMRFRLHLAVEIEKILRD